MPMIQRRSDSQRRIRILSRPAPEAPSPPVSGLLATPPGARFEAPGEIDVLVSFEHQAFTELLAHCTESNVHGLEICGLLLGTAEPAHNQGREYRLAVTDILPLEASDASGAHVSADENVWLRAAAQIEERFQGKERLGWYHTHPTQGIFFSGSDKDFHSVFTKPFQFALVVDPRFPEVGLFHWKDRQAGQIAGPFLLSLRATRAHLILPKPTLADSHRLMLLALGLAGIVASLATGQDTGRLLPLAALFTSALFLRFWNAGAVSDRARENRELRVGPAVGALLLGALLLPFFMAGVRLGAPLPARWATLSQEPQAPPPTPKLELEPEVRQVKAEPPPVVQKSTEPPQVQAPSRPRETRTASPPDSVRREVAVWSRSSQVALIGRNGQRADYMPAGNGRFRVDTKQEAALLKYLLGVKDPGAMDYKLLQEAVGIGRPDGSWGSDSRSALVRKAQECARTGCEIKMSSRTQTVSIVFRKKR